MNSHKTSKKTSGGLNKYTKQRKLLMSVFLQKIGIHEQEFGGGGSSATQFISYVDGNYNAPVYNGPSMSSDLTATDSSGNIYVGSLATQVGVEDIMLSKFAPDGSLTWRYSYPHIDGLGPGQDPFENRFSDIKCDANGDIFACYTDNGDYGPGDRRLTLLKFNSAGDILWQKTIRDEPAAQNFYFGGLTVDANGNAIIMFSGRLATTLTAYNYGFDDTMRTSAKAAYVAKYSPAGTLVWERGFGSLNDDGPDFEMRADLITDAAGNVYTQYMNWSYSTPVFLKLASATGAVVWYQFQDAWGRDGSTNKIAGEMPYLTGSAEVPGLAVSNDGSTLIRAYAGSDQGTSPGIAAILVTVNTTTGAIIGNRQLVHPDGYPDAGRTNRVFSVLWDVKVDPDSGLVYVFGGVDQNTSSSTEAWPFLMCMDLNFNIQWYNEFVITPLGYSAINIDYGNDSLSGRTPRISFGPDNINVAYMHDDNVGVHGILMSINKATGAEAGDLYTSAASATHPSGVTYSVVTTGAPTLINFDTLTDGWFEQYGNFNYQGFPADFSNELLVSETGVTTFGPKAAVSAALSLPTITVL
jgi:hypothetical protein